MIDQLFALRQSEELNIEKIFIPKNTRNFATPTSYPQFLWGSHVQNDKIPVMTLKKPNSYNWPSWL